MLHILMWRLKEWSKRVFKKLEFMWELLQSLRRIEHNMQALQQAIEAQGDDMSAGFDRLTASVQALESQDESLITLVKGLADLIRSTAGNEAAALALADEVDAEAAKVAQAVTDNTPATPTP